MRQTLFALLIVCCLNSALLARAQSGNYGISAIVVSASDEAAELQRQLERGASFEVLAMKHSIDSTAERGGFLGTRDQIELGPTTRSALESLAPGGISAILNTGSAFILLKRAKPEEDQWRTSFHAGAEAVRLDRYPDAIGLLEKAVREAAILGNQDVRLAESLHALSEAYRHQEDIEGAERTARRSLAILETVFGQSQRAILPSLENLAATLQTRGRSEEAEGVYRRILAIRWKDPATPVASNAGDVMDQFAEVLSLAYTRNPRVENALERFQSLVERSRFSPDLYVALSDGLMSVTLVSEAKAVMQSGVRAHPNSFQFRFQLAEFYVQSEKYRKALETFKETMNLSLNSALNTEGRQLSLLYERIATMNTRLVLFDEALEAIRRGEKADPENVRLHLMAGDLHLRRNQYDAAMAEYTQVIARDPGIAAAHYGLSQVHLRQRRFAEAANEAQAALALDSGQQRARYVLGLALIRSGKAQEGKQVLADYTRLEEKSHKANASQADVEDIEQAVFSELTALRLEPAIGLLTEGIDSHPTGAVLYLQLALLQRRLGRHREAVETLETMIRLKLDNFLAHRAVSMEYAALGNTAESRRHRVIYLQKLDAALQARTR